MPARSAAPTIYTARSQFWFGNLFFKPIDMGGRPVEEGDPILATHAERFEPYTPRVRDYPGRVEQATASPGEKRG